MVNVLSKGFSDAPDFILKALMRMDWAGRQSVTCTDEDIDEQAEQAGISAAETLDRSFTPFNELLSLGYMEGDCISVSDLSRCQCALLTASSIMMTAKTLWGPQLRRCLWEALQSWRSVPRTSSTRSRKNASSSRSTMGTW